MKPVLGYWDLRGRVNPIRMLLHYANVDFEDKRYADFPKWFQEEKQKLQGTLDFPNLPYYIDGDIKITQSQAILAHLGRKHNLDGKSELELARMRMIHEQVVDLMMAVEVIARSVNIENKMEIHAVLKKEYLATLHGKLNAIVNFLGSKDWMGGSRLTYVDFYIYETLDIHRCLFDPKHIHAFPTLVAYLKRFENLKGVKEFLASNAYKPMPIFGPMGCYGNTADYKPTD